MKSGSKLLSVVLLFVALILANYLASSVPFRIDATAGKIYTLSHGSKALIAKIEEPVEFDFYFSRSINTLPIALKDYANRVLEMLRQYVRAGDGKIVLKVIDPKPDTAQEDAATAAGVKPQIWPDSNQKFYFGLVAIQADHQKVIPAFTIDRERFLEYDISQLLYQVQQVTRPKLGLLTSLPLQGQMNYMAMQSGQMPQNQYVVDQWQKTYDLVTVDPTASTLPDDLDVLAIIQPEHLSPKLEYAIDQFLLSGKPVFIAVDPSSRYFRTHENRMAMMGGAANNVSSDLPRLFKAWDINYDPDEVVGDLDNAASVQISLGNIVRYPVWLDLPAQSFNATALPTSELQSMLMVESGSLSLQPGAKGLTFTPLITSSAQSGVIPSVMLSAMSPEKLAGDIKPTGPKVLAALIQGRFHTAFPDGPPAGKSGAAKKGSASSATRTAPPGLQESKTKSTLIVVADTDWLLDEYSVRKLNFLGVSAAEPLNDNLMFAGNAMDFLSGSPDLISIRGKGVSLRPFTVVHNMEVVAQQKYQQQLDALEDNLRQVQSQLSTLEGKKSSSGELVATPQMTKAIEALRAQQAKFRTERRKIQRTLREGIEALENRLLMLNLFSTPLLVALFGVWFYFRRRKQPTA